MEVASPVTRVGGEYTFDDLADRFMLKDRPFLRILPTQFCSSVWLDDTVHDQFASILAIVEDATVILFGDAVRATESSMDSKGLAVQS